MTSLTPKYKCDCKCDGGERYESYKVGRWLPPSAQGRGHCENGGGEANAETSEEKAAEYDERRSEYRRRLCSKWITSEPRNDDITQRPVATGGETESDARENCNCRHGEGDVHHSLGFPSEREV